MDLVERIKMLCADRGITLNQMEKALGFKGTVARWADHEPSIGKVRMVAQYFGMTVSELIEDRWNEIDMSDAWDDETKKDPTLKNEDEVHNDEEIREYLQMIKDDPKYRMMFDLTKGATLEEIKATVAFLKTLREQR